MSPSLADVDPGDAFRIESVSDDRLRAQLLRLGFMDGRVTCRHHLRKGPVIISHDGTDLAIGAKVADQVDIDPIASEPSQGRGSG
ncbi:MAG: ferrous iron transport protein A [Halodesulfurarchaeum sp.]